MFLPRKHVATGLSIVVSIVLAVLITSPLPPVAFAADIRATIIFQGYELPGPGEYDAAYLIFRIANPADGARIGSANITVKDRHSNVTYDSYTDEGSFYPSPTGGDPEWNVPPGSTKYLRLSPANLSTGTPSGVSCRATIVLYTADDQGGSHHSYTLDFDVASAANAFVDFLGYDEKEGYVTIKVTNKDAQAALQSVTGSIMDRTTNAVYYPAVVNNSPFVSSPTGGPSGASSLAPGATAYLRYRLNPKPSGKACRVTMTFYTADNGGGSSLQKTADFGTPGDIKVKALGYDSYDARTGWLTFKITNAANSATLDYVVLNGITNPESGAVYVTGGLADFDPFYPTPTSTTGADCLIPGRTAYLRWNLPSHPTGVPCEARIELWTGEGKTGSSEMVTVRFDLPGTPARIRATVTYDSYDAATGSVAFKVVNAADGAIIECAETTIIDRSTGARYYGPSYSNDPFYYGPTSQAPVAWLTAGTTAYMHVNLTRRPTGVPCIAGFKLYSANDKKDASAQYEVQFDLR